MKPGPTTVGLGGNAPNIGDRKMGTPGVPLRPPSRDSGQSRGSFEAVAAKRFPKGKLPDMSPKPDTVIVVTEVLPPSGPQGEWDLGPESW